MLDTGHWMLDNPASSDKTLLISKYGMQAVMVQKAAVFWKKISP
jgi:hypothetical protein